MIVEEPEFNVRFYNPGKSPFTVENPLLGCVLCARNQREVVRSPSEGIDLVCVLRLSMSADKIPAQNNVLQVKCFYVRSMLNRLHGFNASMMD